MNDEVFRVIFFFLFWFCLIAALVAVSLPFIEVNAISEYFIDLFKKNQLFQVVLFTSSSYVIGTAVRMFYSCHSIGDSNPPSLSTTPTRTT